MAQKSRSATYPAKTWEECLDLLDKIDAMGVSAISTDEAAKEYGLQSARTKSFQYRISAAKQYGLISVRNDVISLTSIAQDIIHPTEESTIHLERECFANPPLHKKLLQTYDGKPIPRRDLFENILVRDYGISEGAKKIAASCFVKSAEHLGLIVGGVLSYSQHTEQSAKEPRGREDRDVPETSPAGHTIMAANPSTNHPSTSQPETIYQRFPLRSGGTVEISIPATATKEELSSIKKVLDIFLEGAFTVNDG